MKYNSAICLLFSAWAAGIVLTVGTILSGDLFGGTGVSLGPYRMGLIVLITTLKAILILHYYLDFRCAPQKWQRISYIMVFCLLLGVGAFFLLPR